MNAGDLTHLKWILLWQGLMQAVFDIGIPILGTIIWACPNLILSKTETTVNTFPVFWSSQQNNLNIITRKYKINLMYSLFRLLNDICDIIVTILLATTLIRAPFSQSISSFSLCINPCMVTLTIIDSFFLTKIELIKDVIT